MRMVLIFIIMLMRFAFILLCFWPAAASASGVYFDSASLLRGFFPDAARVGFETVTPDGERPTHVFVAFDGEGAPLGYAVILDERGQHLPITFGVRFDLEGKVTRTEVMAYRENYGAQITARRFQEQFEHKGPTDHLSIGDDITVISGATVSSHSMTRAVRRAIHYVELLRH